MQVSDGDPPAQVAVKKRTELVKYPLAKFPMALDSDDDSSDSDDSDDSDSDGDHLFH